MTIKTKIIDATIRDKDGNIISGKKIFEVLEDWSETAARIAASKYATNSETSVLQIFDRVSDRITEWGYKDNYFKLNPGNNDEGWTHNIEARAFNTRLKDILYNQRACFNSPTLFNVGTKGHKEMASACFIFPVEDNMEDILEHTKREGMVFKWGGGSGINASKLRAKGEELSNKGTSSGVTSFLRIWDKCAGSIRSGGSLRRSAKMVILDINHPDIEEFIDCKSKEEEKAKLLIEAGIPIEEAYSTVDFQNENHSIGITDHFMQAVQNDLDWSLTNRKNKKVAKKVRAKELFRKIAKRAHETGDPGLFFIDRVNKDNPIPLSGRIYSSNPCFTGDMRLYTKRRPITFEELSLSGKEIDLLDIDGSIAKGRVWSSGIRNTIKLTTEKGHVLKCTPDHIWILRDGSECKAIDLLGKQVMSFDHLSSKIIKMEDNGQEEVFDFSIDTDKHWGIVEGFVAHNCAEFVAIDSSSCNLASLNLVKYLDKNGYLIEDLIKEDIKVMITAMDIIVGNAEYPTEEVKRTTKATRPLGLGFSNLGTALIKKGLAYNSSEGREWAKSVIKFITFSAYEQSIYLAKELGSYEYFEANKETNINLATRLTGSSILERDIEKYGLRNSQLTLIAPCGTIGWLMDCEALSIEPIFASKQVKQLVGGGTIEIEPECIKQYKENKDFNPEVILTANEIHWRDHILMVAACIPHLNGSISKTINMSSEATVEDVEEAYLMAWGLGLKGITVYRDGCKGMQPLRDANKKKKIKTETKIIYQPTRNKLPVSSKSIRHKIDIAGFEGYLHVGLYENGEPGEIFIRASKQGSFVLGMLDAFATMVSIAMQYGVPLKDLVDKFKGQRFEPNGITQNEDIRFCTSIIDYIFKWLESNFLSKQLELPLELPLDQIKEEKQEVKNQTYEEVCPECGGFMQQSGTCHYCTNCGLSNGCS